MNFVLYPHWKEQLQHGLNGGSKMLFKVGSHLYCGTPTVHDAAGSEVQTRINMHKQKPIICIIYVKSKLLKQWLTGEHTPTSDPPILILSSNIWYAYIYIYTHHIYIYIAHYIYICIIYNIISIYRSLSTFNPTATAVAGISHRTRFRSRGLHRSGPQRLATGTGTGEVGCTATERAAE